MLAIIGVVALLYLAWIWQLWNPTVSGTGYKIGPFPDGNSYLAIGVEDDYEDAEKAIRLFRGENPQTRPRIEWKVFDISAGEEKEKEEVVRAAKEEVRTIKKNRERRKASEGPQLAAFTILPGILIILLGQGLRYIFAGPRR